MQNLSFLGVFTTLVCFIYAQSLDILSVLENEQDVSQFMTFLSQNNNLTQQINQGVYTVLVPTDNAIDTFKAQNAAAFADNSSITALMEYHVLKDTHASASFTNQSTLVPTLLTNTAYTNVSGGQRVELILRNEKPTFLSAVKAPSSITTPDVFFQGGIIHIIDTVLTIPLSFPATVTKANLSYLTALLSKGGWLNPDSLAINLTTETPDLTIFAPNNPAYGASYTGWDGLTQSQLNNIFLYHVVPSVIYTQSMRNESQYETLANISLTITTYGKDNNSTNPDLFVDQAQITGYNYLTANGVFQIIDQPLDVSTPNARPNATQVGNITDSAGLQIPASSHHLSDGAIAGIVIGILGGVVAVALIAALYIRRRRLSGKYQRHSDNAEKIPHQNSQPPNYQQVVGEGDPGLRTITIESYERPSSAARSINSLRATLWPQRQPRPQATSIIELDGKATVKSKEIEVYEIGLAHSPPVTRSDTPVTRVPTPPELDGVERATSQRSISIHFNGRQPRHIGFQARY